MLQFCFIRYTAGTAEEHHVSHQDHAGLIEHGGGRRGGQRRPGPRRVRGGRSGWETTADQSHLLAPQAGATFAAGSGSASQTITVSPATTYQAMTGFGAWFTLTAQS
jgi:hypothetical protein